MKLLIVDDSNLMRRAIEKYLRGYNLEIIGTAGDGEEALRICRERRPDVITLDITMPKMDGLSCLEEIMKICPETKVLIISALRDPATGLKALKTGARGFLPKPFTSSDLQKEMAALFGGTNE